MIEYQTIIELVKKTGDIICPNIRNNNTLIYKKSNFDFVSNIDISVSSFLRHELRRIDPSLGFLSEEEQPENLGESFWILDPVDGTTNLIYGYNLCSVSLALYQHGNIEFGIVYNPFYNECFVAEKHRGAYLNGNAIHVSNRPMEESIIEFGAGVTHKEDADISFDIAKSVFERCLDIRRICSSALDLCYIAAGRIDGYFEQVLQPWDYAAGSLILQEAGGIISDYKLAEIQFDEPSSVIASNGVNHKVLFEIINSHINKT